jgi:hypothetical protein
MGELDIDFRTVMQPCPDAIRERCEAIYAVHNPSKLVDVGALLAKYGPAGQDWNLWVKIAHKYINSVPTAGGCPPYTARKASVSSTVSMGGW